MYGAFAPVLTYCLHNFGLVASWPQLFLSKPYISIHIPVHLVSFDFSSFSFTIILPTGLPVLQKNQKIYGQGVFKPIVRLQEVKVMIVYRAPLLRFVEVMRNDHF